MSVSGHGEIQARHSGQTRRQRKAEQKEFKNNYEALCDDDEDAKVPVPEPPFPPSDGIRLRSKKSLPGKTSKFADCSRCPCEKHLDDDGSCNALLNSNIVEIDIAENKRGHG